MSLKLSGTPALPMVVRNLKNPTETEIEQMITVFVAAFAHDPFYSFITAGSPELGGLITRAQIAAAAIGGEIYVAGHGQDDILGAALWFGPGQELFISEEQRAAGFNEFIQKANPELQKWWMEYASYPYYPLGHPQNFTLVSQFLPLYAEFTERTLGEGFKLKCWHLQWFGVKPEDQGQGIARALIKEVEDIARPDNITLTLETGTDLNVTIYKALGYTHQGEIPLKSSIGECTVHCLSKVPL